MVGKLSPMDEDSFDFNPQEQSLSPLERLEQIIALLPPGDVVRGELIDLSMVVAELQDTMGEARERGEGVDDAVGILVGENTNDKHEFFEVEVGLQREGKSVRPMRVVGGVDEHGRLCSENLQPPRRGCCRKPLGEDVVVEGLVSPTDK